MRHWHRLPTARSQDSQAWFQQNHSLGTARVSFQTCAPPLHKYTAMQTGQRKRKLERNVHFAQVKLLQVTVLIQFSDSYSFRHALNFFFFFLIKGLFKHVLLKIVNYSFLQFVEINWEHCLNYQPWQRT